MRPTPAPAASLAALAAAALLSLAPIARADDPVLEAEKTVIEAGLALDWAVPLTVHNRLDVGLYLDSLIVDTEVLGPLDPGAPRTSHLDMTSLAQSVGAVSAGDGAAFDMVTPALAESALVVFRLYGHDSAKKPYRMRTEVMARPGRYSFEHPSRFATVGGKRVEFVVIAPAEGAKRPAPGVLLVHGHGASARPMLRAGRLLASRGYFVVLPSQPGYGASAGPADFMGPATIAAMSAVLDSMAALPGVDRSRLALWGFSRGATVAAALAAQRTDVRAMVLQSGIYDLQATYRNTRLPGFRESIIAEAGRDSAAWRARSPLESVAKIHAATLVLHGELDDRVPAAPAHAFAASLARAGTPAESNFFASGGHLLPPPASTKLAFDFFNKQLAQ